MCWSRSPTWKTRYRFELEDGSVVEFKGNEQVEYDGEIHTAANSSTP